MPLLPIEYILIKDPLYLCVQMWGKFIKIYWVFLWVLRHTIREKNSNVESCGERNRQMQLRSFLCCPAVCEQLVREVVEEGWQVTDPAAASQGLSNHRTKYQKATTTNLLPATWPAPGLRSVRL